MDRTRHCRSSRRLAFLLVSGLLLAGCGNPTEAGVASAPSSDAAPPPSGSPGSAAAAAAGRVQDPTSEVGSPASTAAPTTVRIPSIGVDAPLEVLSVDADNELQPPVAWDAAGWYDQSPMPGNRGPSVIAGHLIAPNGPAVFVDLALLDPGDLVTVDRDDGTSVIFAVDRTISAERTDSFPTEEIYGPTPDAQLRLITCDGTYDPVRGHWTRNMVVFASEVAG